MRCPRVRRSNQPRPSSRAYPLAAGLLLTAGVFFGAVGCGVVSEASPDESGSGSNGTAGLGAPGLGARAIPVSVAVVETGTLEVTLRASTTLSAREQVEVVARQTGIVSSLFVEEGDRVTQGSLMAQLDDEEWRLQAQQSEARAHAASDAVERARALSERDLVSDQEVQRLASDARVAESELELAQLRVSNSGIRAPITGIVTRRMIERGQQVGTTNPAFEIADLDNLEAHLAVPEREVSRIQVGQPARILTQEGMEPVAVGTVERIRPVVDAASGTVRVTVAVSTRSEDAIIRPGQFVNVDLVTETLTDRITLPRTSVLVDGAAPRVFIVQNGVALVREVTLGYSRSDQVEIQTGIEPGDTVVVVGQDNLRPEAPVRVMQIDGLAVEVLDR